MRILILNLTYNLGSTGKIVHEIKETLEKNGMDVYVAYGYYPTDEDMTYCVSNGGKGKVIADLMKIRVTGYDGYFAKKQTLRLINVIKAYNPDVINLHNIHSGYLNIPIFFDFLRKFSKPIIWTLHDCWPITGGCAHFSFNNCMKWKDGCYNCENISAYPGRTLFDRSKFQWEDKKRLYTGLKNLTIVTPSYWLRDVVRESFLGEYKTIVIHNGVNTEVFKNEKSNFLEKLNISKKKVLLGVAMSWTERKGIKDFERLADIVDDEFKIILVGGNKSSSSKIIMIDRTRNQKELVELYSLAFCYINFSREETLGMTTIEAMACGTPVITYNETAVPEPIGSGCGIVLKNNTVEDAYLAIKKIEKNRSEYSYGCRKHVLDNFSLKNNMKYLEMIKQYEK